MILSPGQASLMLKTSAPQGSVLKLHRIQQLPLFHFRLIANEKTSHLWKLPHLSELLVICSLLAEPTSSVLTVNFPAPEDELGSKTSGT